MIKLITDSSPLMVEIKGTTKDILSELVISVIAVLHNMETTREISIDQKCLDWVDLMKDVVSAGHAEELVKALDKVKKSVVEDGVKVSRLS